MRFNPPKKLFPHLDQTPPGDPAAEEKKKRQRYRTVFGSPEGREVLADLERATGFYRPIENADPIKTADAVAKRNLFLYILRLVETEGEDDG